MILSMTGFGRGTAVLNGREITVELRSVNSRYFEYSSRIPRSCSYMDSRLKKQLNERVTRGKVELSMTIQNVEAADAEVTVNMELARSYQKALRNLSEKLCIKNDVTVSTLTRFPDVLATRHADVDEEQLWADVSAVTAQALDNFIAEHGLKPVMAVNTHGHFDHTLGVEHLKQRYGVPFALSSKDRFLLDNAATSGSVFGVKIGAMPAADLDLDTLSEVRFGNTALRVIRTPGHTPGSVVLLCGEHLFCGDTLFAGSIGRTDLEGGSSAQMADSLRKLAQLPIPRETQVLPGHGEFSTFGAELDDNYYIRSALRGGNDIF